jgi:hypothetical protein
MHAPHGIAAQCGVAVPHFVKVDLGQPGRRGELLEPPRKSCRDAEASTASRTPTASHAIASRVVTRGPLTRDARL